MSVTQTYFNTLMDNFNLPENAPVAVGISGGADSLFLTIMLQNWAQKTNRSLIALTVNHNLRSEAASEAEHVAKQMKSLKIEHHILTYTGPKPKTRIEEKARNIRYKLLQDFCAQKNISYLCLAHHQEDQAETFLARLARGSGIDGLAAIHSQSKRDNLFLLRPILSLSKKDIIDTLRSKGFQWVEDPMNQDETFERVRWRKNLDTLWQMGLTPHGINLSTKRLARASEALDFYTRHFIKENVIIDNRGFAKIQTFPFDTIPQEMRLRVLSYLIQLIGDSPVPLSLDSLESALIAQKRQATLGHCHIIRQKKFLFISKEHARQDPPKNIPAKKWIRWDRFQVYSEQPAIIRAGLAKKIEKDIPYLVQQSFPFFEFEKTLEKNEKLDYNHNSTYIKTHIEFKPKHKDYKWQINPVLIKTV